MIEDATIAASLLSRSRIEADRKLDVMSGSAGAILGLLALGRADPGSGAIERAVICGRHLVDSRVTTAEGPRAWATLKGRPLAGFSHGASGIGYALVKLHEATGDPSFLQAASEAIDYERSIFSPSEQNWPDLRADASEFMTAWCHGAPGIGLARVGMLGSLDRAQVREDLDIALSTTRSHGLQELDQLCCGNLGRVNLLVEAAGRLARPDLLDVARKQVSCIISRAGEGRAFLAMPLHYASIYNPSLFKGMSGIGYQLLRVASPGDLPSLLLWG